MPPFDIYTDTPSPADTSAGSALHTTPPQLRCRSRDHGERTIGPVSTRLLWCEGCLTRICVPCSRPPALSDAFVYRWNKVCPDHADEWRLRYPEGKSNCICDWDEIFGSRCAVCQQKREDEVIGQIARSRGGGGGEHKWCICLRVVETKQQWRAEKRKVAYCGICHEWTVEAPEDDATVNTTGVEDGLTTSDLLEMQRDLSQDLRANPAETQSPLWEDFDDEEEEQAAVTSLGARTNPMGPEPPSSGAGGEGDIF